jgi:hypothetical protein
MRFVFGKKFFDTSKLTGPNPRQGYNIQNVEKGVYYRVNVDTPAGTDWKVGVANQKTCEIGVIDGHWPELAKCLGDLYADNGVR